MVLLSRVGQLGSGTVVSHGDHRIAMSFAIASLRSSGVIQVEDCANVATSSGFVEFACAGQLKISGCGVTGAPASPSAVVGSLR